MDSRFERLGLVTRELEDGSRVVVSRFGGHVLSWCAHGHERLYLSSKAIADGRQPIRGGVPVCFPQFSGRGNLPKHGFARTRMWTELPSAADTIRLRLVEDDDTLRLWPHRFALELQVVLQPKALSMELEISNTGSESWSFTGALHTYLRLADVAAVRLEGVEGLEVEDTLANTLTVATSPDLSRPIDNVYHRATRPLALRGPHGALLLEQSGFADAVVWNPGAHAAAKIADIGAGEANQFLCVEAAQAQSPVTIQPGQSWRGAQVLRVS